MLTTPTNEVESKQFVDDSKIPISFKPGNPFAFEQGASARTSEERGHYFALDPIEIRTKGSKELHYPGLGILERQINSALEDLEMRPSNLHALSNVGAAYLKAGRFEEAETYLRKAINISSQHTSAKSNLARLYALTNRSNEALRVYHELLELNPDNSVALMNIAQLYIRDRQLERAKDLYNRVIVLDPNNTAAYNNRAGVQILQGKIRNAVGDLRSALRINVKDSTLHNNLGVCYILLKSQTKAIKELKTALTLDPFYKDAIKNLANIYLSQRSLDETIELLSEYLKQAAEDIEGKVLLAKAYFLAKKYPQSIYLLTTALKLAEDKDLKRETAALLNNLGVVSRKLDKASQAREFFTRCIAIEPKHHVALRNLADLLLGQGLYLEAEEVLKQHLLVNSEEPVALALLGICFSFQEKYDAAMENLQRSIAIDARNPLPYAMLSTILVDIHGNCQAAIKWLEQGLEHNPKDTRLLNNKAYSFLIADNIKMARKILDQIDERDYDTFITATRGLLLLKEGDLLEGRHFYNHAARMASTKSLRALVQQKKNLELARYYFRAGETEAAKRSLRTALSIRTSEKKYNQQALALLTQIEA